MKGIKKTIIISLVALHLISFSNVKVHSENTPVTLDLSENARIEMDSLDIAIASFTYMDFPSDEENYENDSTEELDGFNSVFENAVIDEVIPLYNFEGTIVAYYVTFSNSTYAVINNNLNNPIAIEFGEGNNAIIENILKNEENPFIIYNHPFDVYHRDTKMRSNPSIGNELTDIYPDLLNVVPEAKDFHLRAKEQFLKKDTSYNFQRGEKDPNYGVVTKDDIPKKGFEAHTLTGLPKKWAVMKNYNDIAENHCGATAVTNLALIFSRRSDENKNLKLKNVDETFKAVYELVKDGPILKISKKVKDYAKIRNVPEIKSWPVFSTISYKKHIENNRPIDILLQKGLNGHWVVGIGYREYEDALYFRVVNGWKNTTLHFYKPHSGSWWVSSRVYYQEDEEFNEEEIVECYGDDFDICSLEWEDEEDE